MHTRRRPRRVGRTCAERLGAARLNLSCRRSSTGRQETAAAAVRPSTGGLARSLARSLLGFCLSNRSTTTSAVRREDNRRSRLRRIHRAARRAFYASEAHSATRPCVRRLLLLLRAGGGRPAYKLSSLGTTNGVEAGRVRRLSITPTTDTAHIDGCWKSNLSVRVRRGRITFERALTDPSYAGEQCGRRSVQVMCTRSGRQQSLGTSCARPHVYQGPHRAYTIIIYTYRYGSRRQSAAVLSHATLLIQLTAYTSALSLSGAKINLLFQQYTYTPRQWIGPGDP